MTGNASQRRNMHPRNIFRTPPNYTDLAIKYKDFRKVCKLLLTGKVCIDYKNESALRALTQTLLQEYFQLAVDFAPGSLVPTLPLRLNYILWVEDLLNAFKTEQRDIRGIDIGCGSSCIYSMLAAKKNDWQMLALESNAENIEYAQKNVQQNVLESKITVYTQKNKAVIFEDFIKTAPDAAEKYHFCLCNPPFYDSSLADPFKSTTRNPERRPPPHNCHTGYADELACEGGEVQFVQSIIEESLRLQQQIGVFTSMLGHKSSLAKLLEILQVKEISNLCTTEFCQGNTTRWGLAWSFLPLEHLNLPSSTEKN